MYCLCVPPVVVAVVGYCCCIFTAIVSTDFTSQWWLERRYGWANNDKNLLEE